SLCCRRYGLRRSRRRRGRRDGGGPCRRLWLRFRLKRFGRRRQRRGRSRNVLRRRRTLVRRLWGRGGRLLQIDGVGFERRAPRLLGGRETDGLFGCTFRTRKHLRDENDRRRHQHGGSDQTLFHLPFHGVKYRRRRDGQILASSGGVQ